MPESSLPLVDDVSRSCSRLGIPASASELHGALCGWLAGGGASTPQWLGQVMPGETPVKPDATLEALRTFTAAELEDRSFGFSLLLPDDDAPMFDRSQSLFDWCRGFLGGFGLSAGSAQALSEEGREALADIARLAAAGAQEEGDEEDEAALAEIEEFVRVAVLLLHGDCTLAPRHRRRLN